MILFQSLTAELHSAPRHGESLVSRPAAVPIDDGGWAMCCAPARHNMSFIASHWSTEIQWECQNVEHKKSFYKIICCRILALRRRLMSAPQCMVLRYHSPEGEVVHNLAWLTYYTISQDIGTVVVRWSHLFRHIHSNQMLRRIAYF